MKKNFDCIILGGGPAGLSCALYCARAGIKCAIIDGACLGGMPINYCEIENYLGFKKIQGWQLCENFVEHINEFDIEKFEYEEIQSVELNDKIKTIKTLNGEFCAPCVVIALGTSPKKLGIKGEIENIGKGVSYCAVCDGAFYKDKVVAVVGGGNSALEEALYLSKIAKKVYLIHRRNEFRADKIIQERIKSEEKIELVLSSNVVEILSEEKVCALVVQKENEKIKLDVDGVFMYVGLEANSQLFSKQIEMDANGFIKTNEKMQTNKKDVFAIGDIRLTPLRQVITAVSDGAIAGVEVGKCLFKKQQIKI